jgi:glutamate dehydrogenase
LTSEVLRGAPPALDVEAGIGAWLDRSAAAVERLHAMLDDIESAGTYDLTTLPVALREVHNLIESSAPLAPEAPVGGRPA